MTTPPYTGVYINLDRSPQRRHEIEEELRTHKLSDNYIRFPGVDGAMLAAPATNITPGESGCFHAHYQALLRAKEAGKGVHIIEDDVLLSGHVEAFARYAFDSQLFDEFDIIFTDTYVYPNVFMLKVMKDWTDQAFDANGKALPHLNLQIIDLAMREMASLSSYFVGAKSIDRVLNILKDELDAGPTMAVDLCLRKAADTKTLKLGCTVPFLTSLRLEYILDTTITGRYNPATIHEHMLGALLRYSFFIGRDLDGYANRYLKEIIDSRPKAKPNPHHKLIMDILDVLVSGQPLANKGADTR